MPDESMRAFARQIFGGRAAAEDEDTDLTEDQKFARELFARANQD